MGINLSELFKSWLKEHRITKLKDEPIYVYEMVEFLEYLDEKLVQQNNEQELKVVEDIDSVYIDVPF